MDSESGNKPMNLLQFTDLSGFRRVLVLSGLVILLAALCLFFAHLVGMVPGELLDIFGQSELRTIAGLAVVGCLMAAIGYGQN
jgi:mannose/fructose/N-acetylgalactosamine-specific phosphotransferase system component IIC